MNEETSKLKAIMMVDPMMGWFEMAAIPNGEATTAAQAVEAHWLSRCPRPNVITYDKGSEFNGHEFQTLAKKDWGVKCQMSTMANPQSNRVLERMCQVLVNMIRAFELEEFST